MIEFSQITFKALAVHRVGNKLRHEGVLVNNNLYPLADEHLKNLLMDYFLKPFRNDEFYKFTHETADIEQNKLYRFCTAIFQDKQALHEQSVNIAKHLYNQSVHPKVQSGELYVTYFADVQVEDELTDAIGIFKSEIKDTYLKANELDNEVRLSYEQGINIKKLDKGCLVFNTFNEDGYRVMIVDKQARGSEEAAQYWKHDFLQLARVHDDSFNTANYLQLCHEYCTDVFAEDTDKKDQALFLNKSINYFTEHESFDIDDFAETVLESTDKIEAFKGFKREFEDFHGYVAQPEFKISQPAVRSMKRHFRSLIKLDTNIDIKLNSEDTAQYIERGYDEQRQLYYYKVYFREEE